MYAGTRGHSGALGSTRAQARRKQGASKAQARSHTVSRLHTVHSTRQAFAYAEKLDLQAPSFLGRSMHTQTELIMLQGPLAPKARIMRLDH
jgi:hypothetical protein